MRQFIILIRCLAIYTKFISTCVYETHRCLATYTKFICTCVYEAHTGISQQASKRLWSAVMVNTCFGIQTDEQCNEETEVVGLFYTVLIAQSIESPPTDIVIMTH